MSEVSDKLYAAFDASDWKEAFKQFRLLNMEEMLLSLHHKKKTDAGKFATFWNQRGDLMEFQSELPRWEFAYTVVNIHVLPPVASGIVPPDQVAVAARFLKQVSQKPESTLEQNLALSTQAVNYVLKGLRIKAANLDFYDKETSSQSFEHYNKLAEAEDRKSFQYGLKKAEARTHMNELDVCLYDTVRDGVAAEKKSSGATAELDVFRIVARHAKRAGCGNCGENSILAFMYLYDLGVRPLDRVKLEADHDFVVIGHAAGKFEDYGSWGPVATLCDPWAQGWQKGDTNFGTYPGSKYVETMGRIMSGRLELKKKKQPFRVD